MKMNLEQKLKEFGRNSVDNIGKTYNSAYEKYPLITNYVSSAIGTVGGDLIAKQFTDNPNIKLRDIVFTASAAVVYSYLAPKMIEWSTKLTDKISEHKQELKESKFGHTVHNAMVLTAMYLPVNMVYWNYLTIKNEAPITLENNLLGIATLSLASIPYLLADYVAIKKFSQPKTKKFLRPFYSAIEIAWNTLFAGGNYLAKRS